MSESTSSKHGSRQLLKIGEWACSDAKCGAANPEAYQTCSSCGRVKPRPKAKVGLEIGKGAAEKSKGLFSADDWICSKCGNVNWARRNVCNMCNTKKLSDLEFRTGYGGGYNDRQNVEYIEREDDGEFDEFGRKKKKKINTSGQSAKTSIALNGVDDEDEDEDDGEDDDDLDKYDLTADPDLKISIDLSKLVKKEDSVSKCSSDCSCSCSGGECSCEEEDYLSVKPKRSRNDDRLPSGANGERSNYDRRDRKYNGYDKNRKYNRERKRSEERDRYR